MHHDYLENFAIAVDMNGMRRSGISIREFATSVVAKPFVCRRGYQRIYKFGHQTSSDE
jgi:hypothetical protein